MNRLPRQSSRVKPPLRGRAATKHYRGEFAPISAVRHPLRPPHSARSLPSKRPMPPERPQPKPSKPDISRPSGNLFNPQKRWLWLILVALIAVGLLVLERFT